MLRQLTPSSITRVHMRHLSSVSLTIPGLSADVRHDWTKEEVQNVYDQPLLELVYKAATVHRMHFDPTEVQQCTLLSIKTGGCTEDCKYCSQSSRSKTFVKPEPTKKVGANVWGLDNTSVYISLELLLLLLYYVHHTHILGFTFQN